MKDVAAALKFVAGAVAKKDYVPELTYFMIKDRTVTAFNGVLALCHPIDLDFEIAPKAKLFEKALTSMPEDTPVSLTITQTGRLSVKAGAFRVLVSCHTSIAEGAFPQPQGEVVPIDWGLLSILKRALPFVAEDASRPWSRAVKLHGNSAYATNNVILVELWCRKSDDMRPSPLFPEPIVIPVDIADQIVRMNMEPIAVQTTDRAITFHFENGAWVRSQLLTDPWPPIEEVIQQSLEGTVLVPEGFANNVRRLGGFVTDDNTIHVNGSVLSTTLEDGEGAHFDLGVALGDGAFHIRVLSRIAAVATRVNLNARPAVFTAPGLRGVAVAMSG